MAIEVSSNDAQVARGPAVNVADTANEILLRSKVVGDAFDRLQVTAGGQIRTGAGVAAPAVGTPVTSGSFGSAPGLTIKDSAASPGYTIIKASDEADSIYVAATNGEDLFVGSGHDVVTVQAGTALVLNCPAIALTSAAVSVGSMGASTSVNGATPVPRAAAIATPAAPGVLYDQTEMASLKTAIDALRVALTNFGITL